MDLGHYGRIKQGPSVWCDLYPHWRNRINGSAPRTPIRPIDYRGWMPLWSGPFHRVHVEEILTLIGVCLAYWFWNVQSPLSNTYILRIYSTNFWLKSVDFNYSLGRSPPTIKFVFEVTRDLDSRAFFSRQFVSLSRYRYFAIRQLMLRLQYHCDRHSEELHLVTTEAGMWWSWLLCLAYQWTIESVLLNKCYYYIYLSTTTFRHVRETNSRIKHFARRTVQADPWYWLSYMFLWASMHKTVRTTQSLHCLRLFPSLSLSLSPPRLKMSLLCPHETGRHVTQCWQASPRKTYTNHSLWVHFYFNVNDKFINTTWAVNKFRFFPGNFGLDRLSSGSVTLVNLAVTRYSK